MSEDIVNVQVKIPVKKHKKDKLKMIETDNNDEKSFQRLFMKALDDFIGTKKSKKDKKKKLKK
jgi:hypothetical protein